MANEKWLLLLALLASAACSAEAPDERDTAAIRSRIVDGRIDYADPALVALLREHGMFCSGVAVSSRLVLTAAHCARARPMAVRFSVEGREEKEVAVADAIVHPEYAPGTLENDLAVLILDEDVREAEPLPAFVFDPAWVGAPVRLAGFGVTSPGAGDGGAKRDGMSLITSYDATTFRVAASPAATCGGDSGGPVFLSEEAGERWIGITSSGDAACREFSRVMRLDAYSEFFGQLSPCMSSAECPRDSRCEARVCRPPVLVPRELGVPCDSDRQCQTGFCAQALGTCAVRCVPGESSCVEGASCEESAGEFVCVRRDTVARNGGCVVVRAASSRGAGAAQLLGYAALAAIARARRTYRRAQLSRACVSP